MSIFSYSPGIQPTQTTQTSIGARYTHTQSTLSTAWTVNHGLNRYVSITVYRQDGLKVDGTVINNGPNVSTITFALAMNGVAYCT